MRRDGPKFGVSHQPFEVGSSACWRMCTHPAIRREATTEPDLSVYEIVVGLTFSRWWAADGDVAYAFSVRLSGENIIETVSPFFSVKTLEGVRDIPLGYSEERIEHGKVLFLCEGK